MRFPFEIENGGAAWNMPEQPTLQQAAAAAANAIHLVVTTPKGTCFMARDFGTDADALLFETVSEATADQLKREVAAAIPQFISYISITGLRTALARDSIVVEITYKLKYSMREHIMSVNLPMRG